MKRFFTAGLMLILIMIFTGCGGEVATQAQADASGSKAGSTQGESGMKIGFSLAGEGAFIEQLIADIESECSSYGYSSVIITADTAEKQQLDIEDMLSQDVSVIMIDPVDVDALETVLAECEINKTRVINAIDSINGVVNTLVSPNFITIGEKAGQLAVSLLANAGGGCMMLKTKFDSFSMQLMTDGFISAIGEESNVTIKSEQFCGEDEEKAYEATKAELSKGSSVDYIFAQDAALGRGALRAAGEAGSDVKIVVVGGDMDIVESVSSGDIYTAVFFGPNELAHEAVLIADNYVKDPSYEPPEFVELTVETITEENASDYLSETALYAEALIQP